MRTIAAVVAVAFVVWLAGCSTPAKTIITPAESEAYFMEIEIHRPWRPQPEPQTIEVDVMLSPVSLLWPMGGPAAGMPQEEMTPVRVFSDTVRDMPEGATARMTVERGRGRGVGASTSSDAVATSVDSTAPQSSTRGSAATGGATRWLAEASSKPSALALIPIGIFVAAAGGAIAVWRGPKLGLPLVVAGLTIAGLGWLAEEHPIALAACGLLIVGVALWWVWITVRGQTAMQALQGVTRAVEDLKIDEPSTYAKVRAKVAERPESDEPVRALIRRARTE